MSSDSVVFASPVYRASITGAVKNLLDLLPVAALRDKPVEIVAMGASSHHYLAVDWHLRGILAWFGAFVLPTSVYLSGSDYIDGELAAPEARSAVEALGRSMVDVVHATSGLALGPEPLAARSERGA